MNMLFNSSNQQLLENAKVVVMKSLKSRPTTKWRGVRIVVGLEVSLFLSSARPPPPMVMATDHHDHSHNLKIFEFYLRGKRTSHVTSLPREVQCLDSGLSITLEAQQVDNVEQLWRQK